MNEAPRTEREDDEMNCLAFRRAKLTDPNRLSPAAAAHGASCPQCQAFARRIDANEKRAVRAFSVAVPDGLADRIVMRATGRKPASPYRLWALAASVVLTTAIGLAWFKRPGAERPYDYAASAIEHVMEEPESLTTLRDADPERLSTILAGFGAGLREPIGTLRYVRLCPVPEGTAWHLVFDTQDGLITLLLIPGHQPNDGNMFAEKAGMNALVRTAGRGYYAIVANSRDKVESADRMLKQRINWTAIQTPGRVPS